MAALPSCYGPLRFDDPDGAGLRATHAAPRALDQHGGHSVLARGAARLSSELGVLELVRLVVDPDGFLSWDTEACPPMVVHGMPTQRSRTAASIGTARPRAPNGPAEGLAPRISCISDDLSIIATDACSTDAMPLTFSCCGRCGRRDARRGPVTENWVRRSDVYSDVTALAHAAITGNRIGVALLPRCPESVFRRLTLGVVVASQRLRQGR